MLVLEAHEAHEAQVTSQQGSPLGAKPNWPKRWAPRCRK